MSVARGPGGDGSDGCARCFGTNGRPSQWSWRRPCITAQHVGLRAQKTANSAGVRPGVLEDARPRSETEHEQHAATSADGTQWSPWMEIAAAALRCAEENAAHVHGSGMCVRRCSWLSRRSSTTARTRWSRTTPRSRGVSTLASGPRHPLPPGMRPAPLSEAPSHRGATALCVAPRWELRRWHCQSW